MKNRSLVLRGYTGDFFVLLFQAFSIYLFVNNNPNFLYASWVLVLTIVTPIIGLSNMSMDSIVATENSDEKINSYLLLRFRNLFFFFPIVVAINLFYQSNASPWFLLILAYLLKSFEGLSIAFRGIYYRDKAISKANLSKAISKFGYVIGFGYFLQELNSLSFALLIILGWNMLVFIIYDLIYLKNWNLFNLVNIFNFSNHFKLNKKFFLLGLNSFMQLIVISIPQILIERYLSLEILSFVGIVMLFNSALDTVYLSSINSLRKSYSDLINKPAQLNQFINKLSLFFLIYLCFLILSFYFFGDILFNFYDQYFSFQSDVMIIVLLGSFLFYTANLINFRYFVNREVVEIFKLFTTRALCAVLISYFCIIEFQEFGFAIVYLISNLIYLIYTIFKKRKQKI